MFDFCIDVCFICLSLTTFPLWRQCVIIVKITLHLTIPHETFLEDNYGVGLNKMFKIRINTEVHSWRNV